MVQILRAPERKPSVGQRLSQGLGRGLEMGSQMYKEHQAKQLAQSQMQQENEAAKKSLGIDLSGIIDPKARQEYISQALQGKRQLETEQMKSGLQGENQINLEKFRQQGRQNLQGQKQELLNEIFGQKSVQGQKQQIQEPGQSQQQPSYDPLKISDADIARASSMDPNLGRELRAARDTALREQRSERDFEERQKEKSPEFQREQQIAKEQAQADVKYNKELQESAKQLSLKETSLNRLDQLNKKGVTGKAWEKLAEKFGMVNVTTEGRREFAAEVKNLITDIRSILGAQFTGFEFQTILNAYPSADFSQEANSAIIRNQKEFVNIKKKEEEFGEKLKKENGGKIPLDFQSKVNEKVREYAQSRLPEIKANTQKIMAEEYGIKPGNILMLDPQGEPLDVSPEEVERYQSLGATLP